MTCHYCLIECKRFGKDRKGHQRFRCRQCSKTFLEPHEKPLDNMYLPIEKAETILKLMVEGCSIRSIERLTEVHRDTIMRLLVIAGERCENLMTEKIRNVKVKNVEIDEIWGYVFKKETHKWAHEANNHSIGDSYCFTAIERDSKLILTFHLGRRTKISTFQFLYKLRNATTDNGYQLTSDGFQPYIAGVDACLPNNVDFAQLVKVYASSREGETRYSPGEVVDAIPTPIFGNPDPARICTSHAERANLSIRMGMRRMTRLTNGFSKKWSHLRAAYAVWFAFYNFCRVHRSLRVTPAMEAGITDHIWDLAELLA